jgi:hypothetical protein
MGRRPWRTPPRAHVALRVAAWVALVAAGVAAVAWVVLLDLVGGDAWLGPAVSLAPAALLALLTVMPFETSPAAKWLCRGAFVASVVVAYVPWNPRKHFVRDVFSVRAGMSVDEVEAILGGYIKGAGPQWPLPEAPDPIVRGLDEPHRPTATEHARAAAAAYREPQYPAGAERRHVTGIMTYRWSTEPAHNADWGQVHFVDGKVVKVEFLPD